MASKYHHGKEGRSGFSNMRVFFNSWKSNSCMRGATDFSHDRSNLLPRIEATSDSSSTSESTCDDYGSANSQFIPSDVPRGHLPVNVGFEDKGHIERFVIPCKFLNLYPFETMLKKAEEIYGYSYPEGVLVLPVDPNTFRYILQCSLAQHADMPM